MTLATELPSKSPFRQASLARLNNPEQLDRLLTVTTARSWIAYLCVLLLIGATITWSIVGTIPTYVTGTGLFLNEGGRIVAAVAPGSGRLSEFLVTRGETVTEGQVIARLVSTEADTQIANASALVDERERDLARLQLFRKRELEEKRARFARRRAALVEEQKAAKARVADLEAKLVDEQELFDKQIVTRSTVMQTRAQLDQAERDFNDAASEISQIEDLEIETTFQADQRVEEAEFDLAEAQRRLTELTATRRSETEVLAPSDGRIDEIEANRGELLNPGQLMATIETPGTEVEFLLFVSVREGGDNLEAGERVNISPNWTRREEVGTLIGEVHEVSKFPVTPEEIRALVVNEELVRSFSSQGPTYVAHVRLKRDPSTESGYAWTSSRGVSEPITSGGFASADVLVSEEVPIGLAIPTLRHWTHL